MGSAPKDEFRHTDSRGLLIGAGEGLPLAMENITEKPTQAETRQVDASAWDDFAPPRDDKFDWVQLTSDEWLKGDIISLFNYF